MPTLTANQINLKPHLSQRRGLPGLNLVCVGDRVIGTLEKHRNTRTETHPWKAFHGYGFKAQFLGAFYEDRSLIPLDDDMRFGGKKAAIQAILDRENQENK